MCGISGFFSLDFVTDNRNAANTLARMTQSLRHRGPDGTGIHNGSDVCFGFTRLAIIDLQTGDQPFYSEDRSVVCICNGEIYNYRELRAQLQARGHRFASTSDVEVIVHLYEEVGDALVTQIRGQFAFALYDCHKKTFLAARDHVGICPFYYSIFQGHLIFASEIKALLQYPDFRPDIDPRGIDQILTFPGLISPQTMFKGVQALPPGHLLTVRSGDVSIRQYWDLDYPLRSAINSSTSTQEHQAIVIDHLQRAIAQRLNADVPVGFYLSGGLDSTLIGRMIHAAHPDQQWDCFSIGFAAKNIDEQRYQQQALQGLNVKQHLTVFDWQQITDRLAKVVWHGETPLKESYNTCSLSLSEMVHNNGYKVVLSGEGADELFGGYVGYRLDRLRTPDSFPDTDELLEQDTRERLWGDRHFYYERDYNAQNELKSILYSPDLARELASFNCTEKAVVDHGRLTGRDHFHKRSYIDFKLRIADHLLSDHGDRVAMANSVEVRYPFLDVDLIEAVRQIPPELMIHNGAEKYLLKQAAKKFVPDSIISREKFAFVAPGCDHLIRNNRDFAENYLSDERIKKDNIFNRETIIRLKNNCLSNDSAINQTFETDLLMIVLTTNLFLDLFMTEAITHL